MFKPVEAGVTPAIIIKPIRVQLSQLTQLPLQRRWISTVIHRRYRKERSTPSVQYRLRWRRRLGVVEAAVIDSKLSVAARGVDLGEALAEFDISPKVILLSLHSRENDWIDADD